MRTREILELRNGYGKTESAIWDYLLAREWGSSVEQARDHVAKSYGSDIADDIVKTSATFAKLTKQIIDLEYKINKR